ncbi:Crp/Fnr family transcriptional regulator [Oscillatoria sp. FACHB-1407]|uniref:Crp/Fnr family transcriptional regulator n=1 Tax=Oscillatoria sp. FACHB-1407 TaxID=2692847 RepID=UPI0016880124|nr:Crp/Fnr family transcriptional regulator [Oscillatoria sp. FACHB-1407]MBD2462681.1 Crp/Fnr family transcriptional regulator [Oscillatoria sp. FACHB-1407]
MDLFTLDHLPAKLQDAIATRELVSGQTLFRQGDSALALFLVKTGRLKITRLTSERRFVTLEIIRPDESFGESALFSEFYSYTAIAETNSQILVYPKDILLDALKENSNLAEDFMTLLVRKNTSLMMQLELRDIRAAHKRVLQYLHYLVRSDNAKSDNNVVNFDRPLKEVAIDLGLTPATLSRALARLEREGSITRKQNRITLKKSFVA